jgi:hypothetical protein
VAIKGMHAMIRIGVLAATALALALAAVPGMVQEASAQQKTVRS